MNILITGGAGFIGSNLGQRLLAEGHSVWAVDNFLTGSVDNIRRLEQNPHFKFCECGIEDKETFFNFCAEAENKFDRIYHLACATGVPNIEILAEEMLTACSYGTFNVLEIAKKSGARLLFTSSSEVYGEPLKTPQDEKYTGNVETIGPRANYEEGKRFSETLVSHYVNSHKVHAVTVRLFNAYGPNMSLSDTRVIPRFCLQALSGKPLSVQGDGSQGRTFCFISDILDGFETVINKGKPGEVYNLGSDVESTIKEFADQVITLSDSLSLIEYVPRPYHDHSRRMPVLDKVRALGWNNKVDLKTGLKETIQSFKKRLTSEVSHTLTYATEAQSQS
ncbi:MAG: SDR family NAD(P)-dependent oxidoreductase [Candidatus Paceibacterota bacterium]|jgi:nucleoside-diphosphate-sugar epimerase